MESSLLSWGLKTLHFLLIVIWSFLLLVAGNRNFSVRFFWGFLIYFDFYCPHFSSLRQTKREQNNRVTMPVRTRFFLLTWYIESRDGIVFRTKEPRDLREVSRDGTNDRSAPSFLGTYRKGSRAFAE